MALQLYELDIRVTWDEIPSRDDYLAAKQRAWARDDRDSASRASTVVAGKRRHSMGNLSKTRAYRWVKF